MQKLWKCLWWNVRSFHDVKMNAFHFCMWTCHIIFERISKWLPNSTIYLLSDKIITLAYCKTYRWEIQNCFENYQPLKWGESTSNYVEMGLGIKRELIELIKKDTVSVKDRKFREESRSVICGIVMKLFEWSKIICKMVQFTTVFNSAIFLTDDKPPLHSWQVCLFHLWIIKCCLLLKVTVWWWGLTFFMAITLLWLGLFLKT